MMMKDATVIFLYHEVSDTPSRFHKECDLNVNPQRFEKQIQAIKKNFNLLTPLQLLANDYKRPAALITFDDGASGYFENALPILQRHNCPSLIFLNMAPIEGDIFYSGLITYLCNHSDSFKTFLEKHHPNLPDPYTLHLVPKSVDNFLQSNNAQEILSQAQQYYGRFATPSHLNKCKDDRLVYFGNHLYRHHNCVNCTDEELIDLYDKNRKALSAYSNSIEFFSYPFGQKDLCYNEKTNTILNRLKAKAIFAAEADSFKPSGNFFHRLALNNDIESEAQLKTYLCLKRIKQIFSR